MNEAWQTFVHSIINSAVIVRELLVAVSNARLVEAPNKPASAVDQIERILPTAIDVKGLHRFCKLPPSVSKP